VVPAFAIAVVGGLAVGVLTSIGQTLLPDVIQSLANGAAPWSAAAFALAAAGAGRDAGRGAALAAIALLAMLAGYDLSTLARGFAVNGSTTLFWIAAALTVGPILGIASVWIRGPDRRKAAVGVAALASILVGEAAYGLAILVSTTAPVYWALQLALGIGLVIAVAVRLSSPSVAALGAALTAVGAVAFVVLYARVLG
jgi:hypothetical protein